MKDFLIKLGGIITTLFIFFHFGKSLGKKEKENEILKNNEKKKKQYAKNKFNSIDDIINELSK
jgi:hypothetical protein